MNNKASWIDGPLLVVELDLLQVLQLRVDKLNLFEVLVGVVAALQKVHQVLPLCLQKQQKYV